MVCVQVSDRAAPALSRGGVIHFSIDQRGSRPAHATSYAVRARGTHAAAAGFVAVRVRVICAGTVPARLAAVIIMIGHRMPAERAGSTRKSHSIHQLVRAGLAHRHIGSCARTVQETGSHARWPQTSNPACVPRSRTRAPRGLTAPTRSSGATPSKTPHTRQRRAYPTAPGSKHHPRLAAWPCWPLRILAARAISLTGRRR
jgi:hypothetical protein